MNFSTKFWKIIVQSVYWFEYEKLSWWVFKWKYKINIFERRQRNYCKIFTIFLPTNPPRFFNRIQYLVEFRGTIEVRCSQHGWYLITEIKNLSFTFLLVWKNHPIKILPIKSSHFDFWWETGVKISIDLHGLRLLA